MSSSPDSERRLVLVEGSRELHRFAAEAAAAARVGLAHANLAQVEQAAAAAPLALLFDLADPSTQAAVLRLRAHADASHVPALGLVARPNDVVFQEILWWGMDDLVSRETTRPLATRLRLLASQPAVARPPRGGAVVIEGPERDFRVRMARVFANTRHAVRFAQGLEEVLREAAAPGVAVVVSSHPDDAEGPLAVLEARRRGIDVPWLVGATPQDAALLRQRLAGLGNTAVFDTYAPPENALFRANELSRPSGIESRRSARVLYGTVASFRAAGTGEDDTALTYNVSASGLYLRTLAPLPTDSDVWLELTPPRAERPVRLHARVAWARPFGRNHDAVMPPGMGVRIVGESPDVDAFRGGVELYAAAHGYA